MNNSDTRKVILKSAFECMSGITDMETQQVCLHAMTAVIKSWESGHRYTAPARYAADNESRDAGSVIYSDPINARDAR